MSAPTAPPRIHPTALIEPEVEIGAGTAIWDHVHIRRGARIGHSCILGEKTYLAPAVVIGDLCKLNANVYVCSGVRLGRGVLVAAHTVFTNDQRPRATDPDLQQLLASDPGPGTLTTTVADGASIGANCTIGPGLQLGAFCMVGMGSVVTADVPAHALVYGNPARIRGLLCRCGLLLARSSDGRLPVGNYRCDCGRQLQIADY